MGDRVRVDRSTRFYWIGTLSGGAGRSGPGGSIRFYWIATLSGWAIRSEWIDRPGTTGSARSAAGAIRFGSVGRSIRFYWIGAVWRRGRSGSGGSIRFYGIATFSGWAIGSEWIDRPGSTGSARSAAGRGDPVRVDRLGSTGSPRSAGGRSGPSGSIDQVLLDRHAQRRGRSGSGRSVDRSGSTGSARSGGGGDRVRVDRLGSTGSPRSAGGRSGPSGSIDQVLLDRHAQRRGGAIRSGWID